jgi:hypothetical protein
MTLTRSLQIRPTYGINKTVGSTIRVIREDVNCRGLLNGVGGAISKIFAPALAKRLEKTNPDLFDPVTPAPLSALNQP